MRYNNKLVLNVKTLCSKIISNEMKIANSEYPSENVTSQSIQLFGTVGTIVQLLYSTSLYTRQDYRNLLIAI